MQGSGQLKTLQHTEGSAGSKLEQRLIQEIESGELAVNAPILSTPKLAKRFAISIDTAQRILQKLAEKGYLVRQRGKRTLVADRGKRRFTRTIGVIIPNLSVDLTPFSSPFHYEILSGAWLGAETHAFDVKIFNTRQTSLDLARPETMGISAAIVMFPRSDDKPLLEGLVAAKMPCVAINLVDPALARGFHCVNPDYKLLGEMAAGQILKLKKIAFYAGCKLSPGEARQHVFNAFRAVLNAAGINPRLVEIPNRYDSLPEHQLPYRNHVMEQMEGVGAIMPYRLFESELLKNWGIKARILGGVSISRNESIRAPAFFIDLNLIGRTAVERLETLLNEPETPVLELKIPPALLNQETEAAL